MTPRGWSERIFDGQFTRVSLRRADNPMLVVTFDYRMPNRRGFRGQPPSKFLRRSGVDHAHVFAAANDWFINPDIDALESAFADLGRRYDKVRVMGYSMGGYGAFRFARALGATDVIAVSPQASISRQTVPFERRWRAEAADFDAACGDLALVGTEALAGYIAVDPFRRFDMAHARLILDQFPSVELARLPFGGHPATKALAGARRRLATHQSIVAERVQASDLITLHRQVRSESIDYWKEFAIWAARKRPALAEAAQLAVTTLRQKRKEGRQEGKSG